jgi:hypothetical protein
MIIQGDVRSINAFEILFGKLFRFWILERIAISSSKPNHGTIVQNPMFSSLLIVRDIFDWENPNMFIRYFVPVNESHLKLRSKRSSWRIIGRNDKKKEDQFYFMSLQVEHFLKC